MQLHTPTFVLFLIICLTSSNSIWGVEGQISLLVPCARGSRARVCQPPAIGIVALSLETQSATTAMATTAKITITNGITTKGTTSNASVPMSTTVRVPVSKSSTLKSRASNITTSYVAAAYPTKLPFPRSNDTPSAPIPTTSSALAPIPTTSSAPAPQATTPLVVADELTDPRLTIITPIATAMYSTTITNLTLLPREFHDLNKPVGNTTHETYPLCHLSTPSTKRTVYTAGRSILSEYDIKDSLGGGHCQWALSYNNGKTWAVIKTKLRDCFKGTNSVSNYPIWIRIPADAPSGDATLLWLWNPATGPRVLYANCADITIKGKSTKGKIKGLAPLLANYGRFSLNLPAFDKDDEDSRRAVFGTRQKISIKP
ncbi:hypothetical protein BGZ94_001248 [Podila epigama]|nr:hypothetical protein BGZ94_001248 [Podila epigama]